MNKDTDDYIVSDKHLMAFGAIIQWFARHETLIQAALAGLYEVSVSQGVLLTALMPYSAKKDTLQSALRHTTKIDKQHIEQIRWHLGEAHKFNQLRNHIAHSLWCAGTRAASIKPVFVTVRGGKGQFTGTEDDERDYTLDELIDIADELGDNHDQFSELLATLGMFPAILRNIEDNEPSM